MDIQELFDTTKTWATYGLLGGSYVPFLLIMRNSLNKIKWRFKRTLSKIIFLIIYTAGIIALGIAIGVVDINTILTLFKH